MRRTPLDGRHDATTTTWTERDGVRVPARYGELAAERAALRTSVAISDLGHVAIVRVSGPQAWDLLDRLLPCDLFLRNGQARQTLILEPDGTIAADVMVVCDDQDYLLLCEGLPAEAIARRLDALVQPGDEVAVADLGASWTVLGASGPFSWELLCDVFSPGIAGMPYLSLADLEPGIRCVRAGKTGEFGYDLLVTHEVAPALWARLLEAGAPLDVGRAGTEVLDLAALENWFFNVHAAGTQALTPLHLQLQWRVSRGKAYPGSDALEALRSTGIGRRICGLRSEAALSAGDALLHEGAPVGEVVVSGPSPDGRGCIALGLVDLALAFPGHAALSARSDGQPATVRTVSPPFLPNRSLFVRPQWHRYAMRAEIPFPEDP